jgi:hypothetical protein
LWQEAQASASGWLRLAIAHLREGMIESERETSLSTPGIPFSILYPGPTSTKVKNDKLLRSPNPEKSSGPPFAKD